MQILANGKYMSRRKTIILDLDNPHVTSIPEAGPHGSKRSKTPRLQESRLHIPRLSSLVDAPLPVDLYSEKMWLSGCPSPLHCTMVFLGLVSFFLPGAAYPRSEDVHRPVPAPLDRPRPLTLPRRHLSARAGEHLSSITMRMLHFHALAAITPVVHAAQELEQFYMNVALSASSDWASLPRRNSLMIHDRGFSLQMLSLGDTIPWDFVAEVANRLWTIAASGLPYLFDVSYASPNGRIAVQIGLRLAAGAIANSVGSSESDQTRWAADENGLPGDNLLPDQQDWREGSVPSINSGDPLLPGT